MSCPHRVRECTGGRQQLGITTCVDHGGTHDNGMCTAAKLIVNINRVMQLLNVLVQTHPNEIKYELVMVSDSGYRLLQHKINLWISGSCCQCDGRGSLC